MHTLLPHKSLLFFLNSINLLVISWMKHLKGIIYYKNPTWRQCWVFKLFSMGSIIWYLLYVSVYLVIKHCLTSCICWNARTKPYWSSYHYIILLYCFQGWITAKVSVESETDYWIVLYSDHMVLSGLPWEVSSNCMMRKFHEAILHSTITWTNVDSSLTQQAWGPTQNGHHLEYDILKCIVLNENVWRSNWQYISICPDDGWCQTSDNPLSEPMMANFTDAYMRYSASIS